MFMLISDKIILYVHAHVMFSCYVQLIKIQVMYKFYGIYVSIVFN